MNHKLCVLLEQRFIGTFQYDGETSPKDKLDMGMNYLNPEKHLQFHLKVTGERQFIQMQVTMGWFQS